MEWSAWSHQIHSINNISTELETGFQVESEFEEPTASVSTCSSRTNFSRFVSLSKHSFSVFSVLDTIFYTFEFRAVSTAYVIHTRIVCVPG